MFDKICYEKNYIDRVILRIDFLRYVESDIIFNEELEKKIIKYFPKKEKDQIISFNNINVFFDNSNGIPKTNGQSTVGVQKEYSAASGNRVVFSNMFFIFELKKYTTFEEHKNCFRDILYSIFVNQMVFSKRIGLRYINIYDANELKLHKKYFNSRISAILFAKERKDNTPLKIVRSMHTNEYRADNNTILVFRYGLYNPEYPNYISNNSFVLDYDCYSEDSLENVDEILRFVDFSHDQIQALFEDSISEEMRQVMKNE